MSAHSQQPYEQSRLYRIRHTAAHILAQAVLERYPDAKFAIGPPIEDGFYYDFDLGRDEAGQARTFTPDDLAAIEARMRAIIAGEHPLVYRELAPSEARALFRRQPYKLELIEDLVEAGEVISTYRHDTFEDLCRGPHVAHTGEVPSAGLKLMHVAGAYWRGDEEQPMLQRIYGTAWPDAAALEAYLERLEEARRRDHRKLGRELELFLFDEEIGPGLPLWLPRGEIIVEELEKLAWEMEAAAGYTRVRTPHIAKEDLYLRSGHLPYYEEDMYPPAERGNVRYYLRPMNCPFHHKIYASKLRSYRDLPLRLAEYGMVYRYEQSGELFGLLRVRAAQQNDAHIYCSAEQFADEFMAVIEMYRTYFDLFGIEKYVLRLSKHSPAGLGQKYVDDKDAWLTWEGRIREVMEAAGVPYVEAEDEAAFYGPKIDVQVWSAIGREFSLATNQVDFGVPRRFDLTFMNSAGELETPICIHRAPLGSHERMVGFLIEHYAGNFPFWLAPVQATVIPIADRHNRYARHVAGRLAPAGIRIEVDDSRNRMGAKIRQAQQLKVPYMLVVGDREVEAGTVSVRTRREEDRGAQPVLAFKEHALQLIAERSPIL